MGIAGDVDSGWTVRKFVAFCETTGRPYLVALSSAATAGSFLRFAAVASPDMTVLVTQAAAVGVLMVVAVFFLGSVASSLHQVEDGIDDNASTQIEKEEPSLLKQIVKYDLLAIFILLCVFGWSLAIFVAWDVDGYRLSGPNHVSLAALLTMSSILVLCGATFGFRERNGSDPFGAALFFLLLAPGVLIGLSFLLVGNEALLTDPRPFSHWESR